MIKHARGEMGVFVLHSRQFLIIYQHIFRTYNIEMYAWLRFFFLPLLFCSIYYR